MYLIFGGEERAASGGANDFIEAVIGSESYAIGIAQSMIGATLMIKGDDGPVVGWVHVYCTTTDKIVYSVGNPSNYKAGIIKGVIYETKN